MKKRQISIENIYIIFSIVILLSCCIIYGSRFIKLYRDNKNKQVAEALTLGKALKDNNADLKNIKGTFYFTNTPETNYVKYSNTLFRVVKIEDNNVITLITNESLTSLAYGKNRDYKESYINTWLNKTELENSGKLEKNLNNLQGYAQPIKLCNDKIDSVNNITCNETNNDYYISLLSLEDYINTGADKGFINTNEKFYLSNNTSSNEAWYVNSDGKLNKSDGTDIYGIKAIIKLKENINLVSGTGTKADPYVVEQEHTLFGSYVKINDDILKVIDVDGDNVKLVYNDYIKLDEQPLEYKYSSYGTEYNINQYGSLAKYLNNTYLNSLPYKDIIKEAQYPNGYYSIETDYNYTQIYTSNITAKIGIISIGDIIPNHELNNYFTSTIYNNNSLYYIQRNGSIYNKSISNQSNVVPVITIDKNIISLDNMGTIENPLEVVNIWKTSLKEK